MPASDSKSRFSDRVDAYVKYRPHYPRAVLDVLRQRAGLTPQWKVADVGCGTGISCDLFLEHGNEVIGVEPNAPMRDAAVELLSRYPTFRAVDAPAEATTLADRSIDIVVAAQAFHWFDRAAFRRECLRILKPGGVVLLMWNDRKLNSDRFAEEYEAMLQQFGTDYREVNHTNIGPQLVGEFFGGAFQSVVLPNAQIFDFEGIRGRLLSSSYAPPEGHANHQPMLSALRGIFDRNAIGGRVRIAYDTELFFGNLA